MDVQGSDVTILSQPCNIQANYFFSFYHSRKDAIPTILGDPTLTGRSLPSTHDSVRSVHITQVRTPRLDRARPGDTCSVLAIHTFLLR